MTQRRFRCAVPIALLVLMAAGCGDRGENPDGAASDDAAADTGQAAADAAGDATTPAASPQPDNGAFTATLAEWRIELSADTLDAGPAVVAVTNDGTVPHALEVTGEFGGRWRSVPVAPGATINMTMRLSPGTYEVFCPLDNDAGDHSERGMTATLVVR
jgi:plastocyanin